MLLRGTPIRRKLMTMILGTSALALALTCAAFITYDFLTFRASELRKLSTLAQIIAANSTAALAFENQDDAAEILGAMRAEPHIAAAVLYNADGRIFSLYHAGSAPAAPPAAPGSDGYRFEHGHFVGFEPVVESGTRRLGTLYLSADAGALYARLRSYGAISLLVIGVSLLVAYLMSRLLERQVSRPILALAETARAVSDRHDYSVRAPKESHDELGLLTDAFNHMLRRIHEQLGRHHLLNRITRAIGERQELANIFNVVLRSLEDELPIDFGCVCLYDPAEQVLTVGGVGVKNRHLAADLGLAEGTRIAIDQNGLARSIQGRLVYEADLQTVPFPFSQRLAAQGVRSLIVAPLLVESQVFGVLLAARRTPDSFTSMDCDFVRQLSEHVALAAHQAQIYAALQQAYDELRQSQQVVLQQERLRALGQLASGIAHDINNAISPVALYTNSLLEGEPNLSARAREYLETIERAIDDVAATVARIRDFSRQREPQLTLAPTRLNVLVQQVLDLTRAAWSDEPQRRGVVIKTATELAPDLPPIMGAESELREALTNLVINAVDAMPRGGTLVIATNVTGSAGNGADEGAERRVNVEVRDTGNGMDDDTRRRCLEPFFTTKGERGTGLGLAMVYGTVRRHSAEIDIQSAVGQGTTVRLSFAAPQLVPQIPRRAETVVRRSRLRILIVDDDPVVLKALRDTLEAEGHRVVAASGGQQGIDEFRAAGGSGEPFAAVITDLGMPEVDGRQVASAVKALSPTTPVILLTGWGQRMAAEGDVPVNVDRLLGKPPKLRDLNAALASCFGVEDA